MIYLYSIIFAFIQGLTEFLPISSSGHLIILHQLFSFNLSSNLAFDVALHTGTFFALLIFFFKDLIFYLKKNAKIYFLLIIGALPAGIIGLVFEDFIESSLRQIWVVVLMLIAIAFLFIFIEKKAAQTLDIKQLNYKKAFFIGLAQIIALIPGTSRSGITIIAGMGAKLKRAEAARFSFLISLPIFAGATLKKGYDLSIIGLPKEEMSIFIIGFLISTIVGFLCIKFFLSFMEKYSLKWFAYYRFLLAGILIIYLLIIR